MKTLDKQARLYVAQMGSPSISTLDLRGRDALDVHELSVVAIERIIVTAYELGRHHAKEDMTA